jgi:asparagine synthetase B (glutamine-hydrolysing)
MLRLKWALMWAGRHIRILSPRASYFNEQHDIALIVAGECFVDSNTLIGLIKKGHRIENENDWIVHLYEEEGEQLFEKLNGLFSGVLHYRNVRP